MLLLLYERIQMAAEMQSFLFYGIQKPINRRTRHKPQTPQLILVFFNWKFFAPRNDIE